MTQPFAQLPVTAAVARLAALAPLDDAALAALHAAARRPRSFRAKRDMISDGRQMSETLLVLSGWAARVRILADGRRQILSFLLPGDLIGHGHHEASVALSTVAAFTDVDVCVAPSANASPALTRAYAVSREVEEARLLAQITRLGRLNAHEKVADLLLELLDRLRSAGLAHNGRFSMPLTQEVMADALGLTSVHVNRTLQTLRREGSLEWNGREVILPDPVALGRICGRRPARSTFG